MNRSGLKAICMALMVCLMPVGAVAQNAQPGTLCSDGTLGSINCIRPQFFAFDTCQLIEDAARRHGLDAAFFARLLWQESRFDPHAISPAGAQGIAQFMPATAALRGLSDAFNPAEAMERSAHYLASCNAAMATRGWRRWLTMAVNGVLTALPKRTRVWYRKPGIMYVLSPGWAPSSGAMTRPKPMISVWMPPCPLCPPVWHWPRIGGSHR